MKSHPVFSSKITLCIALAVLLAAATSAFAQIEACYHVPARLDTFIQRLIVADNAGHHILHVDTIGWSLGEVIGHPFPIYSLKISDNPDVWEDEPTSLFVGQVHAEEVVGMEVMLSMCSLMVATPQYQLYRDLIQNTQMYFVPTDNPEGLEVVALDLDNSWRKTGYRPPQLDTCHIVQGAGLDSCGVDINRNFDINWIYGDTLWDSTGSSPTEVWDYYRGPSPWSESESRAIRDLALRIKPTISAVFHSSHQGGNAARSIAPWSWKDGNHFRNCPDSTSIFPLNDQYSQLLSAADTASGRDYISDRSLRRYGNLQDWFYRDLGCIQYNTELLKPDADIQPDCPNLAGKIAAFRTPFRFLLDRMLNIQGETQTPVKVVTYANTDPPQPISAEYRLNTWNAILNPWYTDSIYGSAYTLLVQPGSNRFIARKEGYVTDTVTASVNPHSTLRTVSLYLDPLPWHMLTLRLRDGEGTPIAGHVILTSDYGFVHDVTVTAQGGSISLPEGSYSAMAEAVWQDQQVRNMVLWHNLWLGGDATHEFTLPNSHQQLLEPFDNLNNWTAGGTGNPWRIDPVDTTSQNFGASLCNAPAYYRGQYDNGLDATLTYNHPLMLDTNNVAFLSFWRRGRLDMPADSFMVEVSADGGSSWTLAVGYSDLEVGWTKSWINLTPWIGHSVNLRFRFKTDFVLGDLGLHVDNVAVYAGTDLATPERPQPVSYSYRITGSYPNPFNPSTTVRYETAAPGAVTLVLFNTLGQEIRRFDVRATAAGPQQLLWDGKANDGSPVGSGVYFLQLQAAGTVSTHKMLLLR